ncbi:MAG: ATP-dependent helicase, partial [Adhaeribacter sp.]
MPEKEPDPRNFTSSNAHATDYLLAVSSLAEVNYNFILKHTSAEAVPLMGSSYEMQPDVIGVNEGIFSGVTGSRMPAVKVVQFPAGLWFSCGCARSKTHLCEHQAQVLQALITRPEFRVFFDAELRRTKILPVAQDYGLAEEENLDKYFELEYANKNITVKPRLKELLPVNPATQAILQEQLLPHSKPPVPSRAIETIPEKAYLVVIAEHKYYEHLYLELYQAAVTASGKLKNPLQQINPADLIWLTENPEELKFFTAIAKFQRSYEAEPGEADLVALKALVKNPLGFKFYQHNPKDNRASGNITASSLVPVAVQS